MLLQTKGFVLKGAGRVEDRIAEQEAAIAKRQQHLALGQDLAVEIGDAFVLSNAHEPLSSRAIAIWPGNPARAGRYGARPPAASRPWRTRPRRRIPPGRAGKSA